MRRILSPIGFLLLLSVPRVAAAQEFNNPFSVVFDVFCDFDEDGFLESSFEVSTFLNPTGTGRDLASQSTFTAMSGIAEGTLNGETIFVTEIPERPGRGLRTVACEAAATLIDTDGNVLVLTISDATFLVTPEGALECSRPVMRLDSVTGTTGRYRSAVPRRFATSRSA